MNPIGELYDLIQASDKIVAFTGAGVSTASGIRDFRGKHGVYNDLWHGYRVEELFGIELFEQDPSPFYQWAKGFVYTLDQYQPNVVHTTLAELEAAGKLKAVVTQNIDGLHQRAGSHNVLEVHGSGTLHHCLKCGAEYSYAQIAPRVQADETPHCTCGGIIKPDIVFYGEPLPEQTFTAAIRAMSEADVVLILGSSLTVYPAASLPEEAYRCGARLVIVNETPTPLDSRALLKLSDLTTTFETLHHLWVNA